MMAIGTTQLILWAFYWFQNSFLCYSLISLAHVAGDTHTHTHVRLYTRWLSPMEIIHHPFLCHYARIKLYVHLGVRDRYQRRRLKQQLTIHLAPKYKHKGKRRRLIEAANL